MEAQVVYRNLKYDSFEKALDYPDGIAMVIFPVVAKVRTYYLPIFYTFEIHVLIDFFL